MASANTLQVVAATAENALARARERLRPIIPSTSRDADDGSSSDFLPDALIENVRRRFKRKRVGGDTQGPPAKKGRKKTKDWKTKLFLLQKAQTKQTPTPAQQERLEINGLGSPAHERPTLSGARVKSVLKRGWTLQQLDSFIQQSYPDIPLGNIGFTYGYATKAQTMTRIRWRELHNVADIEAYVGQGKFYIFPNEDIESTARRTIQPSVGQLHAQPEIQEHEHSDLEPESDVSEHVSPPSASASETVPRTFEVLHHTAEHLPPPNRDRSGPNATQAPTQTPSVNPSATGQHPPSSAGGGSETNGTQGPTQSPSAYPSGTGQHPPPPAEGRSEPTATHAPTQAPSVSPSETDPPTVHHIPSDSEEDMLNTAALSGTPTVTFAPSIDLMNQLRDDLKEAFFAMDDAFLMIPLKSMLEKAMS